MNVAERALASPQVQNLVSTAVGRAHGQFVSLIEDESEFSSTTGGEVTLQYGSIVADLAARLGIDPATISQIQGVVQEYSVDLKQRLTTIKAQIDSARATLSQVQAGELSPEVQQNLQTLRRSAAELRGAIASLEGKIKGVEDKVPDQLQARLSKLQGRLSDADARLTALRATDRRGAQGSEPGERRNARCLARLAPRTDQHSARAPGCAAPLASSS